MKKLLLIAFVLFTSVCSAQVRVRRYSSVPATASGPRTDAAIPASDLPWFLTKNGFTNLFTSTSWRAVGQNTDVFFGTQDYGAFPDSTINKFYVNAKNSIFLRSDLGVVDLYALNGAARIQSDHADGVSITATGGTVNIQGAGVIVDTGSTGLTVQSNGANNSFDSRVLFTSSATKPGFNWGSFAGNPSSLSNGDGWYNSSTGKYMGRWNGTTIAFANTTIGSNTWSGLFTGTNGGTNNAFTEFTGPTTSTKTFTLPNASATILTTNAAVTAAQGGTSFASYTTGDLCCYATASTTLAKLGVGTNGHILTLSAGLPVWAANSSAVTPAALTKTDDTNVTLTLGGTPATSLLQATSLTLGWTGRLALSRFVQGTALSVLGVTGGSTADFASIAGTTDQVFRVNSAGTALAFGSLDLSKSGTVGSSILTGANGGTENGFTKFTGPTTSLKTFTLPNATATILTDNAAVTPAQGGTGLTSYAVGDIPYASASTTISKLADVAVGSYLRSGGVTTAPLWSTLTLPNTATVNQLVLATSTNQYGGSANLTWDGAIFAARNQIFLTASGTIADGMQVSRAVTFAASGLSANYSGTGNSTMRATAGDNVALSRYDNGITTGSTGQFIYGDRWIPTLTVNHTGATIYGIYWNPSLPGSQTPTHQGLTIGSGTAVFGATATTAGAALDIQSTTGALGLPRMTSTQMNAIASNFDGQLIQNTTTHTPTYYNGSAWKSVGSSGTSSEVQFTDNAGGFTTGGIVTGGTGDLYFMDTGVAAVQVNNNGNISTLSRDFVLSASDNNAGAGYKLTLNAGDATSGNNNGADLELNAGSKFGSGLPGTIVANAPVGLQAYTVAALPASPRTGSFAYVTDALAPAYLATIVGGGSVVTPVFYNGSNWVAH